MTRRNRLIPASLLGLTILSACAGVETGAVSPCHGQFRAEGKYFAAHEQSDGTTVVVTTHSFEEAQALATHLVVISAGRAVATGSPAEVVGDRTLESVYFDLTRKERA